MLLIYNIYDIYSCFQIDHMSPEKISLGDFIDDLWKNHDKSRCFPVIFHTKALQGPELCPQLPELRVQAMPGGEFHK